MAGIIPDPDFEGFDGIYLDHSVKNPPPNEYNLSEAANYLRKTGKQFSDLTREELESFKFKD